MRRLVPLALCIVGACSEAPEPRDEGHYGIDVEARPDGPGPLQCAASDIRGTYYFKYDEYEGDCGFIDSHLFRIEGNVDLAPGCKRLSPDIHDNCRHETHVLCEGTELYIIADQEDEYGTIVTGLMTMTVDDGYSIVCVSTYEWTATRR